MTQWTVATRLLCPWDFPHKNMGVGYHFLLQGIFPTQGSNPCFLPLLQWHLGLPGGLDGKKLVCNAGDLGSIPGLGRSPEEGNGNPLQYSCLEKPMDRGVLQVTVHWVTKGRTRLNTFTSLLHFSLMATSRKAHCCSSVTQLCPNFCDPMDCSPAGSFVHGIFQARMLEWVAISFFRGSSQPRDRIHVSCVPCTAGRFFYR